MITPGRLDLTVQRWTQFVYLIDFEGIEFINTSYAMQVRLYRDAPGSPLLSLVTAAAGAEGISTQNVTVNEDGVPVSTIQIRINETTLEGLLLNAGKPGEDVRLVYDLHITGGGFPKTRWLQGAFVIAAGVTQ